ncbi:MAG: helix-turn-helix domain-containing protein [Alcanivorax sp.]|nr:helix-turn-helix domain-containing protein [Alcanivorax sp.]
MAVTTLKNKLDKLPPERRQAIQERTCVLATLSELRRALDCTQQQLAEKLAIGQDSISRLEKRSDMRLSTLRAYVEALGGSLDIVARFPDQPPVSLNALQPDPAAKPAQRTRKRQ